MQQQQQQKQKQEGSSSVNTDRAAAAAMHRCTGSSGRESDLSTVQTIKDAASVTHESVHLAPILHETIHSHEIEEVTVLHERERHRHFIHQHFIPIHRARQIQTRAYMVIETEVLPEIISQEEVEAYRSAGIQVPPFTASSAESSITTDPAALASNHYQLYAQKVHDRAVAHLSAQMAAAMLQFEAALPLVSADEVQRSREGSERSGKLLHAGSFGV